MNLTELKNQVESKVRLYSTEDTTRRHDQTPEIQPTGAPAKGRKWSAEEYLMRGMTPKDASKVAFRAEVSPEVKAAAFKLAAAGRQTLGEWLTQIVESHG